MATVIRFARHGTKKKPLFRIVVQDSRSARNGRFIESLGLFNPVKGDETLTVARDRLLYWLGTGAQMSLSVKNRLKIKLREWSGNQTPSTPPAPPKKAAPNEQKKAGPEA